MGCDRTAPAASAQVWSSALLADAGDHERDLLRSARRHRLAAPPKGPAAQEHGLSLVQSVARYRAVRDDEPRAGYGGPGEGWARSFAQRRRDRQPKRQDDR